MKNFDEHEKLKNSIKHCLFNGLVFMFLIGFVLAFLFSIIFFKKSIGNFYHSITSQYPYALIYMGTGYLIYGIFYCIGHFLSETINIDTPSQKTKNILIALLGFCVVYNTLLVDLFSVQIFDSYVNHGIFYPYLFVSGLVLYFISFTLFGKTYSKLFYFDSCSAIFNSMFFAFAFCCFTNLFYLTFEYLNASTILLLFSTGIISWILSIPLAWVL